jgi:hypothetical protein
MGASGRAVGWSLSKPPRATRRGCRGGKTVSTDRHRVAAGSLRKAAELSHISSMRVIRYVRAVRIKLYATLHLFEGSFHENH